MGKFYVTMTDRFLSGWGHADGLINKLIFVCDNYAEANIVESNAEKRGDMIYINVSPYPPARYYRKTFGDDYQTGRYYVQIKSKDNGHSSWYKPNHFGNR